MEIKDKILELKSQNFKQSDIARILNISASVVSYHYNTEFKERTLRKKREKKYQSPPKFNELSVEIKKVCWKEAEAMVNAKLISLGYETFFPFNGGGQIDLIGLKDKILYKIQVKSISPTNTNQIEMNLTRAIVHRKNIPKKYDDIDFFIIYDGTNFFKLLSSEFSTDTVILRYKAPRNNQQFNVRMAFDYLLTN